MPRQKAGRRVPGKEAGATAPSPTSHDRNEGVAHHNANDVACPVARSRFLPAALLWAASALTAFAVLAISDHAPLSALAALGAVVLGAVSEVVR